jgi:hypothetical protein
MKTIQDVLADSELHGKTVEICTESASSEQYFRIGLSKVTQDCEKCVALSFYDVTLRHRITELTRKLSLVKSEHSCISDLAADTLKHVQ